MDPYQLPQSADPASERPVSHPDCSTDEEALALGSLILTAVGISHRLDREEGKLLVREEDHPAAEAHLRAYMEENQHWPPREEMGPRPGRAPGRSLLVLFGGLAVFFQVTGPWQNENPWFSLGAVDSLRVLHQGEWWRLVTGLTLHADYVHLVGNCLVGGAVLYFLGQTMGFGMAWLAVILAGSAGNLLNCVLRSGAHLSVGFSTAVFAAIGIFSGGQISGGRPNLLQRLLLSLGAGLGLLALLGTEGKQTDLGAHFFGFCCGVATGVILRPVLMQRIRENQFQQLVFFVAALALVLVSWMVAWSTGSSPEPNNPCKI